MCGKTEGFRIKVGVYYGSVLSPYPFSEVIDEITRDIGLGTMVCYLCPI